MRRGWQRHVAQWLFRQADRVICVSRSNLQEARVNGRVPEDKLVLVYHGFELPVYTTASATERDLVVTIGDVTYSNLKRKGLETFVRCASLVPEGKFVLVGRWKDNSVNYLKNIAARNVQFTGQLTDFQLKALLNRTKVYVQASCHEAFGCALAEAMLMGAIPVVTDRGALPEVVGPCGWCVPYGNMARMAEAIHLALCCDGQKSDEAKARTERLFPWKKREKALVELVKQIMESST